MSNSVLVLLRGEKRETTLAFVVSGTIAEILAGWEAVVWSADARGFGIRIDFAMARGFFGNVYSNYQIEPSALLQCFLSRALLFARHVTFYSDLSDSCQTACTLSSLVLSFLELHCPSPCLLFSASLRYLLCVQPECSSILSSSDR